MNIRPVTVEFLRAGPRHNQLLSPLTQYLAMCGGSSAGVVNLPYEHAEFERRREELRYAIASDSEGRLKAILEQTGREMGEILSLVPGLAGVLNASLSAEELLYVRLSFSYAELALLPFELSKVPKGGGSPPDAWLLLQGNAPVVLTRHERSVSSLGVRWPIRPHILFAWAGDVPHTEHLEALRTALRPWTDEGGSLEDWLTVLPDATLPRLQAMVKTAAFTHVHILAHGAPTGDTSFGVLLSDSVVGGRELASALVDVSAKGIHKPTVVTLATCDSGGEGAIVNAPDASVAHSLHATGIPLVIASQFPLSVDGSTEFVKMFYAEQLEGTHPLLSIYRARLMLHAYNASRFHDWASLVVYEALPPNLPEQLYDIQYYQRRGALERTLVTVEKGISNESLTAEQYAGFGKEIERARQALPEFGPYEAECAGLRAATFKRVAQLDYLLAKREVDPDERSLLAESCFQNLQRARREYLKAADSFLVNVSEPVHRKATLHWLLGQVLSLEAVLGMPFNHDFWTVAKFSATAQLAQFAEPGSAWGYGTLAELHLLRLADPELSDSEVFGFSGRVLDSALSLVNQNGFASEPVMSTSRQFERYIDWWSEDHFEDMMSLFRVPWKTSWRRASGLIDTANHAIEVLGARRLRESKRRAGANRAAKPVPAAPQPPPEISTPPATLSAPPIAPRAESNGGSVFRIEMLPAKNGDCLWIEYGDAKRPQRVLIDCGAESAAKLLLARTAELADPIELFMLTHIDSDHIGGVLPFFRNRGKLAFQEVWFNAEPQLPPAVLGVMQGEQFAKILDTDAALRAGWNRSAGEVKGVPAPIVRPEEGLPPSYMLSGGMRLTILSPRPSDLRDLAGVWRKELKKFKERESHMLSAKPKPQPVEDLTKFDVEKLANAPWKKDPSVANGSSIAVLAEFDGRRALLTGDAHAPVVQESIGRLLSQMPDKPERLKVDVMKLSHHGSTNALTRDLLGVVDCGRYMISSDGSKFYHPDREAVARVICFGGKSPTLFFNYRSEMNAFWGEEALRNKYGYGTEYPAEGKTGKVVEL